MLGRPLLLEAAGPKTVFLLEDEDGLGQLFLLQPVADAS